MSYFNIDGKIVNLTKCELCGAYKVVGKSCACEKKKTPMSNSTQNEDRCVSHGRIGCGNLHPLDCSTCARLLKDSTQNDWAERFDKQFITQVGANIDAVTPWATLMEIKSFIRNELADARKEVIDRIEKVLCNHNYSSMKSKKIFNVKEEIRDVLATLREEEKHG